MDLSTGARVGELMGAVWATTTPKAAALREEGERAAVKLGFVELDARTWHLPETKNQRDHTIHLSDFAVRHFEQLLQLQQANLRPSDPPEPIPWIFPNAAGNGPICPKALGKQLSDRQREPERRLKGRSKAISALRLPGGRWRERSRQAAKQCRASPAKWR